MVFRVTRIVQKTDKLRCGLTRLRILFGSDWEYR